MLKYILPALLTLISLHGADFTKADYYIDNNHKSSTYLCKADSICQAALSVNPKDAQALWRLSSIQFTIGYTKKKKAERLEYYKRAKEYAEKAKTIDPKCADAWFWYGTSLSGILEVKGIAQAITYGGPIKKAFEKGIAIDPTHVGSMGALARWHVEAPGILGGDIEYAMGLLKKALSIDSCYTVLHITLAKAYIKQKKYSKARDILNKCLAVKTPTVPAGYYLNDKKQARELLAKIKDK